MNYRYNKNSNPALVSLPELRKELKDMADPVRARLALRYFKTGKGEYGYGDKFLGLTVPMQRKIAKKYVGLSFADLEKLLKSKTHEERFVALVILTIKMQKTKSKEQDIVAKFYLKNLRGVNNWDLVDTSAPRILGAFLFDKKDRKILYKLAKSQNLWARRVAIISTLYFIVQGQFADTLAIAKILLQDTHDLIHKAVGWMLREVGKRSRETEEKFLQIYYKKMPRTMLRYAIEKFPVEMRRKYLKK